MERRDNSSVRFVTAIRHRLGEVSVYHSLFSILVCIYAATPRGVATTERRQRLGGPERLRKASEDSEQNAKSRRFNLKLQDIHPRDRRPRV